ncbi:NAD(P)-dependent oxidoreductase [Xylocopilactobacillus apis]|uniref:Dihydrofolate reductase n=1 Tax=Xylocopilactobacillus apis TaxID=2932183 RepID=A0AAU9D5L7_9LACO|nr:NAD(P)-dependent oxidoreductase [Xylocopilactobacillus apis]BDR56710.1 dihydrofolate reductase [Xylocopilactobacillus apis]
MAKLKVLVTGIVPRAGLTELNDVFDVTYEPEKENRSWVLEHLKDYDGLLIAGLNGDRELIDAGTNLKIITTFGVGFDHVDVEYAKNKGIVVSNCPQSVLVPTAEMTFALILATVRRLQFYDHSIRSGKWLNVSEPQYMGMDLQEKTLGVYGLGRIGSEVARFAQTFGMKVIYHNRRQLAQDLEGKLNVQYADFDSLVVNSDVITLHAPALPSTTGVFNADVFKKMKNSAYIINSARGALVNQSDLIKSLQTGDIAGAGLDVFENEPEVPQELRELDNVIMTPHAGTGTMEARVAIAKEASKNLISYLRDQTALNQVNK